MAFESETVQLQWVRNNLVIKRGTTQLLIEADKVQNLRSQADEDGFSTYFMTTALVNRVARRTFQSWERKDPSLLKKLFQEVMS